MKKNFAFLFSILLILVCFGATIFAQETTGEISGTVKDASGAVVPNVSITIKGQDVGFTRTIQSDDNGKYQLRQVPPGSYTISTAAVSGFTAQTKQNVGVSIGNASIVDFSLGTSVGAVVNVTEDAGVSVDATETKAQDNISAREIDALPKGTGFSSLLKTTASVRPEPLGGQFSINGATGPENSFMIDGQETQNYKNGLLNTNNDIPFQALQEIQVKTSGFEAEFGGATGGVINGVTKSGSNAFHGEFGMAFNTNELNARPRDVYSNTTLAGAATGQNLTYFRQNRDSGVSEYPTISLGGPIVKDKLWFFGIHSPRVVNTQRTTNFVTQNATGQFLPTTLSSTLLNLGAQTTETATEKTTYNYSQLRLDASPISTVRISSSFTWNPIADTGALLGGTTVIGSPSTLVIGNQTFQGSDAAKFRGGRQNSNNTRLEGTWTPTSKLVILGRYTRGFQNQKLGAYGIGSAPRYICQVVPTAVAATAGCAQGFATAANDLISRDVSIRTTIDAQASYLFSAGGRHELKGGYQNSKIYNDVLSGNASGVGRSYLFYVDPADATNKYKCFDPSITYVQWNINAGAYPCPANSIGTGVNYQFATFGTATNTANTLFIQDKWQPTSRLTFNLGLRDEQENIPAFNQNAIDLKFKWADKLAPRLGVAYALTGDGKTKISAFYGRFFDRLKFSLPQGSFGGQFYHVSYFYITADKPGYQNYTVGSNAGSYTFPNGGKCPITSGSAYVCDQDYRIASNIVGADVLTNGAVDPNVKPYQQSEMTFEFQREIMKSTVLTARFLYRHLDQAIEDTGIPTAAGEAYVIGNPGQGLAAQLFQQLGYKKAAKPERVYKAFQVEYDTRFIKNLNLNLNYTLSRLWGNYSGLASTDEINAGGGGRTDPNVTRSFDEPWVGFTASGQPDNGLLGLDRTHVFKASGTYVFDWFHSSNNESYFSFFTTTESGTPKTTFVNIMGIPIPQTKRGDLGRMPMFTQTDINLSHRVKFGSENKFWIAFDFNVLNAFNENNVIAVNQNFHSSSFVLGASSTFFPGCANNDKVCVTNILTGGGVLSQYAAAETAFSGGTLKARNIGFNQPIAFQDPRAVRFGLRFGF